jgi:DNA replication and repair protein RecF
LIKNGVLTPRKPGTFMAVLSLRTTAFRNLEDKEVNTASKEVFLIGENGQGKTNFLEALYFCAYASSFRGIKDKDITRSGESDFSVSAVLGALGENQRNALPVYSTVKFEKKVKTITINGKKIEDRKDILETIPCVAFCHEDMDFVHGSQERRRWFFDQTQSLYDPVYLDDLRKYRRVLKTRNAVLREHKYSANSGNTHKTEELLDVLDPQLIEYGKRLMEKRIIAAEVFSAVFTALYYEVSGIAGVSVLYAPSWKKENRLMEGRAADLAHGTSVSGPHRDRYLFVKDKPQTGDAIIGASCVTAEGGGSRGDFAETASTGQRRLLALLLRVAQARCFSNMSGKTPVLLLDDVLLELDGEKRQKFLLVMPEYEQAFFTFLPEEPYNKYAKPDTLLYYVKDGSIRESK